MNADEWKQVKKVFRDTLDVAEPDRSAYLEDVCQGLPELRAKVEAMLESHEAAGDFMDDADVDMAEGDWTVGIPHSRFGVYRIDRKLGVGGMG